MSDRSLSNEHDTSALAAEIASLSLGGATIALEGDLGAGKTTLVRYLVDALGGRASDVSSPTFALEHEYVTPKGLLVEHWDLYRLTAAPQELLEPPGDTAVRLIEWASRCPGVADRADLVVSIAVQGDGQGRIARLSGRLAGGLRSV